MRIEQLARVVRARAGAALADHRHERGARASTSSASPACCRMRSNYALVFGAWVALTEVLPYLGPWLGAIPPVVYALVVAPAVGCSGSCCSSSGSTRSRGTSSCRT